MWLRAVRLQLASGRLGFADTVRTLQVAELESASNLPQAHGCRPEAEGEALGSGGPACCMCERCGYSWTLTGPKPPTACYSQERLDPMTTPLALVAILVAAQAIDPAMGIDPETGNRLWPLQDDVVLTTSSDRVTYYRGERIQFGLTVANVSDHAVQGFFDLYPARRLATVLYRRPGAASFAPLQCFPERPFGSGAQLVRTLGAGEQIEVKVNVSLTALTRSRRQYLLDAVGTYQFKVDYVEWGGDPYAVLDSNVLTVEVVDAPSEEQEAQTAYTPDLAYLALARRGSRVRVSHADMIAAEAFLDRYRESRYAGPVREGLRIWLSGLIRTGQATTEQQALYEKITSPADTTPPELYAEASPAELWPPNHKLVRVSVMVDVSDADDPNPTVKLESITCDDDCVPEEDVKGAELGTEDYQFQLRSERKGSHTGRTYWITYSATDASRNRALAAATVVVPHDRGNSE